MRLALGSGVPGVGNRLREQRNSFIALAEAFRKRSGKQNARPQVVGKLGVVCAQRRFGFGIFTVAHFPLGKYRHDVGIIRILWFDMRGGAGDGLLGARAGRVANFGQMRSPRQLGIHLESPQIQGRIIGLDR